MKLLFVLCVKIYRVGLMLVSLFGENRGNYIFIILFSSSIEQCRNRISVWNTKYGRQMLGRIVYYPIRKAVVFSCLGN